MATQSVTQSIIESIISPKIVDDGTGGYVAKTDIVNVHNLQVDTINGVEPVFGGGSSFTNDHFGTVTFTHNSGGVIQIQNADITVNSIILVTPDVTTNTQYFYGVMIDAGVGFRIYSSNTDDLSNVRYFIAKY